MLHLKHHWVARHLRVRHRTNTRRILVNAAGSLLPYRVQCTTGGADNYVTSSLTLSGGVFSGWITYK